MSKEAIIKELPDSFVRQMRNWVLTCSCVGMYAISPAYEGMPNTGTYGPRTPSSGGEISDLEWALLTVPIRYRQAVMLFWQYEGNDLVWMGRRLSCDFRAVERRVREGHDRLRQELARREARRERQMESRGERHPAGWAA
ncbi:MAG TPA: hypothetical protein VJT81_06685 [Burkholderiales bacterium]|nr:hypothetical protein [Burkholderiales bacterium]